MPVYIYYNEGLNCTWIGSKKDFSFQAKWIGMFIKYCGSILKKALSQFSGISSALFMPLFL